jgi:hypothetical protein
MTSPFNARAVQSINQTRWNLMSSRSDLFLNHGESTGVVGVFEISGIRTPWREENARDNDETTRAPEVRR